MARVAAEARHDESVWTLAFQAAGWQQRLRTKDQLTVSVAEARRGPKEYGEDLSTFVRRAARADSVSKITGALGSSSSAGIGSRALMPSNNNSSCASPGGKENNGGLGEWSSFSDVGEDGRSSSGTQSAPRSTESSDQSKLVVTVAESFVCSEGISEPRMPVISSKVGRKGLKAAGPLLDNMDEEPESWVEDVPVAVEEVDNFIIHAQSRLVSITSLPLCIAGVRTGGATPPEKIYVVGTFGPDRLMFKERVDMWRLMLDPTEKPRFLVRTKEGAWVTLLNPKSEYKELMSNVRLLGHFLNFVKKRPSASPEAAEMDLQKKCKKYRGNQCLDMLVGHKQVIKSFIEEDEQVARAPIVRRIFSNLFPKTSFRRTDVQDDSGYGRDAVGSKRTNERLPLISQASEKDKRYKVKAKKPKPTNASTSQLHSDFHHNQRPAEHLQGDVREAMEHRPEDDLMNRDVETQFTQAELNVEDPPICIICDDGGSLLYCDGPCHRHFHPTKEAGAGSFCKSLGLSKAAMKAMRKYYCPNCKHDKQQCFLCGQLGSTVSNEVRCCDVPFCNRFFHTECAAKAICAFSAADWSDLTDAIEEGNQKLYCPRHCCSVCGGTELVKPGMLVQCRRCPKAWHRECLTDFSRSGENRYTPIWRQCDREFIYCRDHKILPATLTPAQTHIRFPHN